MLAAILLALLMAGFIVYGSLYPFRFQPLPPGTDLAEVLRDAWAIRRPGRGDLAANLVLYAPLGLALSLAFGARLPRLTGAGLALLLCLLLSAAMETGQAFLRPRTPSGWDVVLNGLGAAAGALAGALVAPARARDALAWQPRIADAAAAILLACWLGYRLYPYVPALDLGEWRASLSPLLRPWEPDWPRILRLAVFWLVAGRLLDAVRPGGERGALLALAMLATIAAAVPLLERRLSWEEIVAPGLALPAWLLLRGRRGSDALLLAALLAGVLLEGAQPYRLLAEPRPFGWIPLRSVMAGHWGNGLQAMLYKFFLYGGVAWLGLRAGLRLPLAGGLAIAVALGIGLLQTWLPGRSAEITDALIAAAAVLLLHLAAPAVPVRAGTAGRPAR